MPALARLEGLSRGFSRRHAVVMAVQDDMLTLTWMAAGERQWRRVAMPADCCRDGLPMQRESLGEHCADLLLDSGLPPTSVDLELLMPVEACQWRLLAGEGASSLTSLADVRSQQPLLEWPFRLDDGYLAAMTTPGGADAQLLVGVQRLMLQAWVDVAEAADLSLRRVDWLLASAWRGLVGSFDQIPADLIWLVRQSGGWRVLLLKNGLPELDRLIGDGELDPAQSRPEALRQQLERTLSSWDAQTGVAETDPAHWQRYWWITARFADQAQWLEWMAQEVHGPILGVPKGDLQLEDAEAPDPLLDLALKGGDALDLLQERRPELGLPSVTPVVQDSRRLLLKGAGWGGGLVLLGLLGLGAMAWWEGYQAQQLEALLPVEQRVLATEAKLRRLKARTITVAKDNKQIAQQLVAVRSGSALLEQLRQIAPQGVQFKDLSVNGDAIKLSGVVIAAGTPGPLERINSLVLTLEALPGSKRDGVKVVKATRSDKADSSQVSFNLTWALDPEAKPSAELLEALGAVGMASRLRMLEQQGVEF
jgi:type IV pilus assembly protein PilN